MIASCGRIPAPAIVIISRSDSISSSSLARPTSQKGGAPIVTNRCHPINSIIPTFGHCHCFFYCSCIDLYLQKEIYICTSKYIFQAAVGLLFETVEDLMEGREGNRQGEEASRHWSKPVNRYTYSGGTADQWQVSWRPSCLSFVSYVVFLFFYLSYHLPVTTFLPRGALGNNNRQINESSPAHEFHLFHPIPTRSIRLATIWIIRSPKNTRNQATTTTTTKNPFISTHLFIYMQYINQKVFNRRMTWNKSIAFQPRIMHQFDIVIINE